MINTGQVQQLLEVLPRRTAIVGMAKNAGKTVVFNSLIEKGHQRDIRFGVTSIGRDGERLDTLTQTPKPQIHLPEGALFATGQKWLEESDLYYDLLEKTSIQTTFGPIVIGRVTRGGRLELSGGNTNEDHKLILDAFDRLGCDKILIDGAMDRQAIMDPKIVDACIISTGAVLSKDMDRVLDMTQDRLLQLSLQSGPAWWMASYDAYQGGASIGLIQSGLRKIDWLIEVRTGIENTPVLAEAVSAQTHGVVFRGALTSRMLEAMWREKVLSQGMSLVVEDASKLFLDPHDLDRYRRRGIDFWVIRKVNVIAVTLNPTSPQGHVFDPYAFLEEATKKFQPLRVVDVQIEEADGGKIKS